MDPVTQGLLGAAAAQVAVGHRIGRRATVAGLCGGLLPDADVFLRGLSDPALPFDLHRHFTHALVSVPAVGALAAIVLCVLPGMRRAFRGVWLAATVGALTHGPLDWLTSFGTRILWPFSERWFSADLFPIVDPLFTLALLIGVVRSWRRRTRAGAVLALAFVGLYLGAALVQHGRAADAQARLAERRGHTVLRGRLMPQPGSLLVWRSVYATDGLFFCDVIRTGITSGVEAVPGMEIPTLDVRSVRPAREPERVREVLRRFSLFADGYTAWSPEAPSVIGDMRFGVDNTFDPLWGVRVGTLGERDAVAWVSDFGGSRRSIGDLWETLLGRRSDLVPLDR